jgi:hypothetical protein
MKNKATVTIREINVQVNTDNAKKPRWARINCAKTGEILHTGQIPYIVAIAKRKYNKRVELS